MMNHNRIGPFVLVGTGYLAAAGGCLALPPAAPGVSLRESVRAPGEACYVSPLKDHVHIFAVNGTDPFCVAGFDVLCDQLRGCGYRDTRFGRLCTGHRFAAEIRGLRAADPEARVVLIGYSTGCNSVRSIANDLNRDGVKVDLLVYLAGDYIRDVPSTRPDNVCRIVSLRANGMIVLGGDRFFNCDAITGACNLRISCHHLRLPIHEQTLPLLLRELEAITPVGVCRPPLNLPPSADSPGRPAAAPRPSPPPT
jgi:hypothetical protein